MARRGWSAANFLRYSTAVATAYPVTMACWAKTSITATQQFIMGLYPSASASTAGTRIILGSGNAIQTNGVANAATTSTTITANTWFHAACIWAADTDRRAFLNGGGKGTNTGSVPIVTPNRTSIGCGDGSSATSPFAPAGTGDIAEAAIWNIALADADIASLALGVHPFLVRPDALISYWPLIGAYSPEINLKSNTALQTMQGTLTQSAHTRIFMPSGRRNNAFIAAAADTLFAQACL